MQKIIHKSARPILLLPYKLKVAKANITVPLVFSYVRQKLCFFMVGLTSQYLLETFDD